MRSLPSIMKPHSLQRSEDKVQIPDMAPLVKIAPDGEPEIHLPTKEECAALINQARAQGEQQAQQIRRRTMDECEELLNKARTDALNIRREAWENGFQEGATQSREEIVESIEGMQSLLGGLVSDQQEYLQAYGQELPTLAVDIAAKILHRRIEVDPLELADLVKDALDTVRSAEWVSVQVSDQLPELVRHLSGNLSRSQVGSLQIKSYDLPPDGVIIESAEGVVDASVSTQLENLRELLREAVTLR